MIFIDNNALDAEKTFQLKKLYNKFYFKPKSNITIFYQIC